ncbi:formyltransferase family protein [Streptomyces melanogenes]|uniref:Formyltransferase family protein n=1 Tax=Streptomyces melanogenes TaxID=67326 RepID=A0ABZ1XDV2_9ACTN|nr:formyltransferase family protein [Streptomyces melanogenes]
MGLHRARRGDPSLLLVTDRSAWGELVGRFARVSGAAVSHMLWEHGDPVARDPLGGWEGDWIIGFRADYVLSGRDLKRARRGALNFRPGPPDIRGVGMYEVALARSADTFGVTCHHMVERVDAGPIVEVERFPVAAGATGTALCEEAAARAYLQFLRLLPLVVNGAELPVSTEEWHGPLHTWAQLRRRAWPDALGVRSVQSMKG